jgi:hypothetical protein
MGELETLNMLLRIIGSSPVNSLETKHPDAANAQATMDRIRRRAQRKGWWCNIDYNMIIQPDSNNLIILPKEYSSVVLESSAIVQRGRRLYNKLTQSGIFTSSVKATRVISILPWDDMPEVMKEYCAYYSGAEFVRDELEDPQKESSLKESAASSLLDLKKQELEEGQYNIFKKNRVAQARGGIQPYSRGNTRFHGDPDV